MGILCYEMIMGRSPFVDANDPMQTYQKALRGELPTIEQGPAGRKGGPSNKARDLPISPYISIYLPVSPCISLYLHISPCISLYLPISPQARDLSSDILISSYISLYLPTSPQARDLSSEAYKLVEALLVTEPSERLGCMKLGVGEIKRHSFFAKTNWQRLEKKLTQAPYIPTVEDPFDVSNYETDWEVPANEHAALNTAATAHLFEGFSS